MYNQLLQKISDIQNGLITTCNGYYCVYIAGNSLKGVQD